MKQESGKHLVGEVLEEDVQLTFAEVVQSCRVSEQRLKAMIDEGVIEPLGGEGMSRLFDGASLKRVLTVVNLERELGVNLAGAALVIDLLDELHHLKSLLQHQRQRLAQM